MQVGTLRHIALSDWRFVRFYTPVPDVLTCAFSFSPTFRRSEFLSGLKSRSIMHVRAGAFKLSSPLPL
jgi:hypothetical protein